MNGKFLQWLGIAALVGVGALAAAALVLVPPKVKVVMGEGEAERGPDRLATVEADVAALREDLRALAGGLEQGLGGLGESLDALDGAADARAKEVRDSVARFEALQRDVAALRTELSSTRAELGAALAAQAQLARTATSPAAGSEIAATSVAGSESARSGEPVSTSPAVPSAAEVASEPEPTAAAAQPAEPAAEPAAAKKRGFLSFKLPSDAFAFDRATRFAIVPALSRVGFDAKSTLHDFSGVTSKVDGELVVCLARPAEGASGRVKVQGSSLDTGLAERDENMRTHLDTTRFPELSFEWLAFEPESVDVAAQKVVGTARGKFTLHGVTRDFAMKVTASVDASKRVTIQGQAPLDITQFEVEVPNKLGLIGMEKEVTIWIALCARPIGLAEREEAAGAR
ncbi:MAG: YceI family protein [Planctomycetes bacterium]|nr:YceI family protein [Planctomycetota bacterium]